MANQMFDDPEPFDENEPAAREEMYELHRSSGDKPADLVGATLEFREGYSAWLKQQAQKQ